VLQAAKAEGKQLKDMTILPLLKLKGGSISRIGCIDKRMQVCLSTIDKLLQPVCSKVAGFKI
jgi:hypothetical protein